MSVRTVESVPKPSWQPDIHAKMELTNDDIDGPMRGQDEDGIFQADHGTRRGLSPGDTADFVSLCEKLLAAIQPKFRIGPDAVLSVATDWLFEETAETLASFCLQRLPALIKRYTILVPIAHFHIQGQVRVGSVVFQEIARDRFDGWHATTKANVPEHDHRFIDQCFERLRQRAQGHVAGVLTWEADELLAQELARLTVEESLAMLRFFAPTSRTFTSRSYCTLLGREDLERAIVFRETGGKWAGHMDRLLDPNPDTWFLTSGAIASAQASGLNVLSGLLVSEALTKFQSSVLSSVRLFSDSTLEARLDTRLVLLLAALEALFLRDASEPIQQNLSDRLALTVRKDRAKRRAVAALVKRVYKTRSRFAHHGRAVVPDDDLRDFAGIAHQGILTAVRSCAHFPTVQDFVSRIDDMKFE